MGGRGCQVGRDVKNNSHVGGPSSRSGNWEGAIRPKMHNNVGRMDRQHDNVECRVALEPQQRHVDCASQYSGVALHTENGDIRPPVAWRKVNRSAATVSSEQYHMGRGLMKRSSLPNLCRMSIGICFMDQFIVTRDALSAHPFTLATLCAKGLLSFYCPSNTRAKS